MGKIRSEGEGEVQEAIDVADFAVGLSRQLYGKTMHSERPGHRMYEQWHPLGPVGVITAFNFPVAVWAWNAMIAAVCGDTVIWKPSELTPLTSIAVMKICSQIASDEGFPGLFTMLTDADAAMGKLLAADCRVPLISATGSCRMGKAVAAEVAARFGRTILELGGNNAAIVLDDADLKLAVPAIVFGAVGTAGQRCTSTRRIIVQKGVRTHLEQALIHAYGQIRIGDPLQEGVLMGPLVREEAVLEFLRVVDDAQSQGADLLCGGRRATGQVSALFVEPTLMRAKPGLPLLKQETFAPLAYILEAENLRHAIELQNDVPQGLSSTLFTRDLKSAEQFLSAAGSDCGIANVNIGTSGAEIGGAFGGEKETGGGRESGSDSWKQYMRRQTNTINYSDDLPLAQGVKFDISGQ
jgi:aldehyde dehydrogenase (NAD+)